MATPTGSLDVPPWPTVRTVVAAVLRRPDLWGTALGAVLRLAAPGWWRRRPYVPLPDAGLWAFRMVTAYGRPDAPPQPADVLSYLEWCRSTRSSRAVGRAR